MTQTTTNPMPQQPPSPPPPSRRPPPPRRREPAEHLVFSPLAWLKLQFFLHAGDTEVGGFGVCSEHDPLYVEDFATVRQRVTPVTVEFADDAVADHFDRCVDAGLFPSRFARLWLHTHPGDSPLPSGTDEETFGRVFGTCDWSVMFIVSRTGQTYARLAFAAGPGGAVLLRTAVDWAAWPQVLLERGGKLEDLFAQWAAEFERNVCPVTRRRLQAARKENGVSLVVCGDGYAGDDAAASLRQVDDCLWGLDELHEADYIDDQFTQMFEGLGQGVYL